MSLVEKKERSCLLFFYSVDSLDIFVKWYLQTNTHTHIFIYSNALVSAFMPLLYHLSYSLEYDMKSGNVNFSSLFYRLETSIFLEHLWLKFPTRQIFPIFMVQFTEDNLTYPTVVNCSSSRPLVSLSVTCSFFCFT